MRKLCYSAFIAFWASVATIIVIHTLSDGHDSRAAVRQGLGLDELVRHNSKEDCWMAIESEVYDLTAYLDRHPGGPGTLLPWCGKEATAGMRTKGTGADHSRFAWEQLRQFRLGTLQQGIRDRQK